MATKKISEFTTLGSLSDSDILPVVNAGSNKKITGATLKTYAQSGLTIPTDVSDLTDTTSLLGGGTGPQGPAGNDGAPGQGVPTGGTVGQVLAKIDSTDYNTEWVNQTSGSGFGTIAVAGSSDVIADGTTEFELVAGTGIAITTGSNNQITISAASSSDLSAPYKGFRAHYGSMYDNNDDPNGPINKLVIYKSSVTPASAIDTDTSSDDFQVTGLTGSDVVAMLVVVSDNITQTSLADLKTFVEKIIDEVILDGGVEGDVNTVSAMQSAFYANFSNFNTIIPSVKTDLEFFSINNQFSISPQYTTGDGATFNGISYNMSNDTLNLSGWGQTVPYTHEVGDVHVIPGNTIQDANSNFLVTPDNDVTVTITGVSAGAIQTYTVTGTLPRPAEIWPSTSISDGGDDEYDGANAIHTNLATDISYNSGNVVSSSGAFNGGDYVVTYQAGIFGMFATGCDISTIGTSGNSGGYGNDSGSSGFDGEGVAVTGSLYSDSTPDVTVSEITNTSPSGSTYSVSVATNGVISMTTSRGGLEFGALPEPGGPSHFHIMRPASENGSGGTDLYFGDDYNYMLQRPAQYGSAPAYGVEIGANDRNGGDQHVWRFGTDGTTTFPTGNITSNTSLQFTTTFGNYRTVEYQTAGVWDLYVEDVDTGPNDAWSWINVTFKDNQISKPQVFIENQKASDGIALRWTFDENGNLNFPRDAVTNTDPYLTIVGGANPTILSSDASLAGPANLAMSVDYLNISGSNGKKIVAHPDQGLLGADANMVLITNFADPANNSAWTFGTDGKLTLPEGGVIEDSASYIKLTPAGGSNAYQALLIYPTAGDGDHIHLAAPTGGTTDLYLGNDLQYVKIENGGHVVIQAADGVDSGQWVFNKNGDLTAPGNIILNNPVTTVTTSVTGTIADSNGNPFTFRILKADNPQLVTPFADPNFVLKWTGSDAGSAAAAAQAPGGQGPSSLVSDDGTYWNFNSWFGLNSSRPNSGTVFTVEYGVVDSDTMISTTDTNLVIEADTEQWKFGTDGNLTLPAGGDIVDSDNNSVIKIEAPFVIKTTGFDAFAGGRYGVNTTSNTVTATLPPSPAAGDAIWFADAGGAYATNNLIINPGSNTIMSASGTMTVSTNDQSFGVFYNGTTWRVY